MVPSYRRVRIDVKWQGGAPNPDVLGTEIAQDSETWEANKKKDPPEVGPCSDLRFTSLISEGQLIEVDVVGLLFVISIHLIVDGYTQPARGRRSRTVRPVQVVGDAVQSD